MYSVYKTDYISNLDYGTAIRSDTINTRMYSFVILSKKPTSKPLNLRK